MSNSSSASDVPFLLNALLMGDLCVNLVCLPISAINFIVIFHTQIIHRNLKFVLLCQCLAVVLYASIRIAEIVLKYTINITVY